MNSRLLFAVIALTGGLTSVSTHASVTFTFNQNSLTTTVMQGSDGAANPNIVSVSPGYYAPGPDLHLGAGASIGYYGANGLGVSSPTGCGALPANTSTARYRCDAGSDSHYVDNSGNGAVIERRTRASAGDSWSSWSDWRNVPSLDEYVRFAFDTDVIVTSVRIGLWDWYAVQTGGLSTRKQYIDLGYNTGDNASDPWTAINAFLVGSVSPLDLPYWGKPFDVPIASYGANDWFGFGAGFDKSGSGFKILALTVEYNPPCNTPGGPLCGPNELPLPGTLGMLGLGAAGLAFAARRRRQK